MIQFIAAAAVGVGLYAATRVVAREINRIGRYMGEAADQSGRPIEKVSRLEKDEATGRYRPVPLDPSPDRHGS